MTLSIHPLRTVFLLALMAFLPFALSSCSKGDSDDDTTTTPPPPAGPLALTVSVSEAAPYQFVKVQLPAGAKPASTTATAITVTVGTASVTAYANAQALASGVYAYSMLVPELPAGSHKISLAAADGRTAEGGLTVKTFTKVTDVAGYIKTLQDNATKEISDAGARYEARVQAGQLRRSAADSAKTFLQLAYNKNKQLVDALSDEEKRIYVQLVEANKSWLADFKTVLAQNPLTAFKMTEQETCEDLRQQEQYHRRNYNIPLANHYRLRVDNCEARREDKRIEASSIFGGKMKNAYEAAKDSWSNTPGVVKGSKAFISTFVSEAASGWFETATGLESLKKPFAIFDVEDTDQRMMAQEFVVDSVYNYTAGVRLVNLNSTNAAAIPGFAPMIQGIGQYNDFMTDLGQFLPYVPEMQVPAAKSEKVYMGGYTIDAVSDSRVAVQPIQGTQSPQVKLSLTSAVVQEQFPLTFRVNLEALYGKSSRVIEVNLVQPIDKILVRATPFRVTKWSEGGQDMFQMHEIWRWQCNNTTYINQERVVSASLSFAAGGTGSSSELWHEVFYENTSPNCDVRKVDRQQSYSGSIAWSFNRTAKTLTATFKDDEGNQKTVSAGVTVQNGALTISGSGLLLELQK